MNRNNRVTPIPPNTLPSPNEAVKLYRSNQGHLTDPEQFGSDPLVSDDRKREIRRNAFVQKFPDIFHQVVNGNTSTFREALLSYIDITHRLLHS